MKLKVVGSHLCPDTLYALNVLKSKQVDFDFVNISASLDHLKVYLALRDKDTLYNAAKENGKVGIPGFIKEDGTLTMNIEDVL